MPGSSPSYPRSTKTEKHGARVGESWLAVPSSLPWEQHDRGALGSKKVAGAGVGGERGERGHKTDEQASGRVQGTLSCWLQVDSARSGAGGAGEVGGAERVKGAEMRAVTASKTEEEEEEEEEAVRAAGEDGVDGVDEVDTAGRVRAFVVAEIVSKCAW